MLTQTQELILLCLYNQPTAIYKPTIIKTINSLSPLETPAHLRTTERHFKDLLTDGYISINLKVDDKKDIYRRKLYSITTEGKKMIELIEERRQTLKEKGIK